MYRLLSLLPLSLLATLPTLAQQRSTNNVDEVVWVVGDQPILRSEVEVFRLEAGIAGKALANPYATIPEQLAIQKLFIHQAETDSIEVSDEEVLRLADFNIERDIRELGSRENLEAYHGKPYAQIRERYKETARAQMTTERVKDQLTKSIKVTPAETREFFAKLPQDSVPFVPTQVEVQIITAHPTPKREEVERIEERLRNFAHRVNSGETDFGRLAKMYSQDWGTARNGGEVGLSGRNMLAPEFAAVAFSLSDPKKVSKIVRTDFGYHIMQLIENRGDKVNVRHILLKPEIAQSEFEASIQRLDSIADDIRAAKFSFEEAARVLSDDKDTRNNHGLMVYESPMSRDKSSRFEMEHLPQDIAKVVDTLKVGEVSRAFRTVDEKTGAEICVIVKLKNRIEGHRANMAEDFQILKNVVLQRRQNEVLKKWLTQKIKTTYTRISPEWRNQQFEYEGWVK